MCDINVLIKMKTQIYATRAVKGLIVTWSYTKKTVVVKIQSIYSKYITDKIRYSKLALCVWKKWHITIKDL